MEKDKCDQPDAPQEPCCICGTMVRTCERNVPLEIPGGSDYTCPEHADSSVQLCTGNWVCSWKCYEKAVPED